MTGHVHNPSETTLARASSGFRASLVSHSVRLLCKVVGVVVLARLVSPAEHGLFAMAASLTFLLTLFRDFGLGTAAVQARELNEGQKTGLLWLHTGLGFALMLLTLLLTPLASDFYRDERLTPLLLVMSAGFVLSGLSGWPRALLGRELLFVEINRLETAGAIVGTVLMIGSALLGAGAYAFAVFLLSSEAVMLLVVWRVSSWRPSAPPDWMALRPLVRTGLNVTGYHLLLYGLQQADTLLMGRWFGAWPLGLYNRASQLLLQPTTHLAAPFGHVLMATLARLGRDSPFFARQFRATTNAIAHFTLPLTVACMILPEEIVRAVLGANWPDAAPLLAWLALSAAALLLTSTTFALCVSTGQSARLSQLAAVSLPVTLLFLWAGRNHGPVGLAAGLAAANICLLPLRLWWSSRHTPVGLNDFAQAYVGPIAVAVAFAAGLWLGKFGAHGAGGIVRTTAALIGGSGAIGACALLWPRLRKEMAELRSHLPRFNAQPLARG